MSELQSPPPEFDEVADIFWRLGVMQSPSYLHGYTVGLLAVGDTPSAQQWPDQVASLLQTVEPPNALECQTLLDLQQAVAGQLAAGAVLTLLLPDEAAEITQRIDALAQWCRGFLSGFAQGGKALQSRQGARQYSDDVSEVLQDIGAISQVGLSDADSNENDREQDYVELCEYLRVAAVNVYLDCQHAVKPAATDDSPSTSANSAVADLFGKPKQTLH